ncbi:MAG: hypothetical protein EBW87_03805, partial [Burkholderiaceae bacterium]|nr:hypothetical protein [Burkholderiaceae bacterium]
TQPTITNGEITAKPLTLVAVAAQNKTYDGTTTATIVATLVGIVSGDLVTFSGTGTFASSDIATGIAVTSTATLAGTDAGNYTFVQPTGLTANITGPLLYLNTFDGVSACPTQGNTPVMATDATGTGLTRTGISCTSAGNVFNSTALNNTSSVNNTSYIEFSASTSGGRKLNVTGLYFFRQASASAPNKLEVRYSTDGFATSTSWDAAPNTPTTGTGITWDFTDFTTPVNSTVTFRIYPYGATRADLSGQSSSSGTFRVDDVTIYGNVVNVPTAASIATTGTNPICLGNASAITATITGGTAPYTVVYSNGTSYTTVTSYISGTAINVSPSYTTSYSLVSVTDANGNALTTGLTDTATVTVNSVTASSSTGIISCNGDTTTVMVSATGGTAPYSGTGTYTVSAGSYSYTVTDANGCTSTTTGTVTQPTAITATISESAVVCQNSTSPLVTFTGSNGAAPYTFTYQLNGLTQTISTTGSNTSVTISVSTATAGNFVYKLVSVIDANNCSQAASGEVTITVNPTPTAVAPSAQTYCAGTTASAITLSGTPEGVTFDISGGSAIGLADITAVTSIPSFSPTEGTATVTITPKANGCTGTPVTYFVDVNGQSTPNLPAAVTICPNATSTATLTVTSTDITSPIYTWQLKVGTGSWTTITSANGGGTIYTGLNTNTLTITRTGTTTISPATGTNYRVLISGTVTGCASPLTSPLISTTSVLTVLSNNTIVLSSAVGTNAQTKCINTAITNITYTTTRATGATVSGLPDGVTGAWVAGTTAGSGTVTISGTPTLSGSYPYTVTLTGGCGDIVATGTITVSQPSVAGTISGTNSLCLPNTGTTLTLT